jgi:DNA-binding transcriptional ArsR family regulator
MALAGSSHNGGEPPITDAVAERLADTMFALSTPSRVLILGSLLDGPRSVSDLTEALGMEQSAVSHQLRVLREHDLVRAEKVGRIRLYALYDEHVSTLLQAGVNHVNRAPPPVTALVRHRAASRQVLGGAS